MIPRQCFACPLVKSTSSIKMSLIQLIPSALGIRLDEALSSGMTSCDLFLVLERMDGSDAEAFLYLLWLHYINSRTTYRYLYSLFFFEGMKSLELLGTLVAKYRKLDIIQSPLGYPTLTFLHITVFVIASLLWRNSLLAPRYHIVVPHTPSTVFLNHFNFFYFKSK